MGSVCGYDGAKSNGPFNSVASAGVVGIITMLALAVISSTCALICMVVATLKIASMCEANAVAIAVARFCAFAASQVMALRFACEKLARSKCPNISCQRGLVHQRCSECSGRGLVEGVFSTSRCPSCRGYRWAQAKCHVCEGHSTVSRWRHLCGVPVTTPKFTGLPVVVQTLVLPLALWHDRISSFGRCPQHAEICAENCDFLGLPADNDSYVECLRVEYCFVFLHYMWFWGSAIGLLLIAFKIEAWPHVRLCGQFSLSIYGLFIIVNVAVSLRHFLRSSSWSTIAASSALICLVLDLFCMLSPYCPSLVDPCTTRYVMFTGRSTSRSTSISSGSGARSESDGDSSSSSRA